MGLTDKQIHDIQILFNAMLIKKDKYGLLFKFITDRDEYITNIRYLRINKNGISLSTPKDNTDEIPIDKFIKLSKILEGETNE